MGRDFFVFFFLRLFFSSAFFFFERTRPAASVRPPCLIYLFTSTGVRKGCYYLISLSVCACACNIRGFYSLRELYDADFHKPGNYGSRRAWANAWDVLRRTPSQSDRCRRAAVDSLVSFGCGGFFLVFCSFKKNSFNAHGLLQVV